ncbi:response regulator transcription factor [Pseudonocardia sp. KRD-184]|nr:response regulator transcription factor [Pseudonocardia oceani]MBW0098618.1 response regulator transcription factor [Pseudonocardia oceani]MBW0111162.1 response regulator transcription factor [Pseudonocardia oceani]MBW0125053.1 response regulator transcription factor [Pseudonocardia oceani]
MTRAVDEHPLLLFYRRTGHRVPLQIADVPEQVAGVRVRGGWADIGRPAGAAHQLSLPLRLDAGGNRSFVLGRPDVFGEQDLRLGTLLWRLLSGLDRQLDVLGRARPDPTAAVRLTPRQQAVLGLLAEGCTAAAIGHRLLIAERTVHKHLERVYAALGVSDRLTAVLRARDLGLLAPVRDLLEDAPTP